MSKGGGLAGRAHPRSRGEHSKIGGLNTDLTGSSPLTRGALRPSFRFRVGAGLIPAHAGSTRPTWHG